MDNIKVKKYSKRSDGRYYTKIKTGITINGKDDVRYIYGRTIAELESNLMDVRYELNNGLYSYDKQYTVKTWSAFWLEYYIKPNVAHQSYLSYQNIFKNHISTISNIRLSKLTQAHIVRAIALENGHWDIQRRIKLYLNQLLKAAKENGLVTSNAAEGVHIPKKSKNERRPLNDLEKEAIKKANFNSKQKAYIYLLLYTGIRRGEALALKKSNIDLKNRKIHICSSLDLSTGNGCIKDTKTSDSDRWLDIYDNLQDVLTDYLECLEGELLFPSSSGKIMSKTSFRRFYESILKEMNNAVGGKWHYDKQKRLIWDDNKLPGLTSHIFRHNFATILYYSSVDIKEAVRLMGHSDEKMILEIYAHLDRQKSKSKDKLNYYFSNNAL